MDSKMDYSDLSEEDLINQYWTLEISIARMAADYHQSEDWLIENSHTIEYEDRCLLGITLWKIVHVLREYNKRKRLSSHADNVIPLFKRHGI